MKKQQLKLSLNKMKIASISNIRKIIGGNGTTVNGQCGDDIMTFNGASCLETCDNNTACITTSDDNDTSQRPTEFC